MKRTAFIRLLQQARDHLTLAIDDAHRGDDKSAIEHVEQVGQEMLAAAKELDAA